MRGGNRAILDQVVSRVEELGAVQNTVDQRIVTLEALCRDIMEVSRVTDQRTMTLEALCRDLMEVTRVADRRTMTLEALCRDLMEVTRVADRRTMTLEALCRDLMEVTRDTDGRAMTLETLCRDIMEVTRVTDQRTMTLVFQENDLRYRQDFIGDYIHKWYLDNEVERLFPSGGGRREYPPVTLIAEAELAVTSADHLVPDSTTEGVYRDTFFVKECMRSLGNDLTTLDIGTGAGGIVYEFAKNGARSFGIEGSDHCKMNKIGYWSVLGDNLFTCDATRPFYFADDRGRLAFDLITSWEVMEHIQESDIPGLLSNVHDNLSEKGWFVGSVSTIEYNGKDGTVYHVTIRDKEWWRDRFMRANLVMDDTDDLINRRAFYRGNGPRFQDIHNYFDSPSAGFHFTARRIS